jgi:UTP--glucose-1-phosphate uridylyltransferase
MQKRIRKAVFPVAGMGSRFLPATKASPKEMMPVVDKPLIQYAVEEAVSAGVTEMIFITGKNKRAIEDHFDKAYELETELEARGKHDLLDLVRNVVPRSVNCIYIRQPEPLGLGHAVLCSRPVVGQEPFAVILADDLIDAEPSVLKQMSDAFERLQCSMLGVQEIPPDQTRQYGIVRPRPLEEGMDVVEEIVEKPDPRIAPSRIAVVGRYILTPAIFELLELVQPGAGGEIQLTDAIAALLGRERVVAHRFKGTRYDCGSKLGYLAATVAFGRKHAEVGREFEALMAGQKFGG